MLALAALLAVAGTAQASVIVTLEETGGYTVSSTDLINGLAPWYADPANPTGRDGSDATWGSVTDGVWSYSAAAASPMKEDSTLIYQLDTTASPAGYDLSAIDIYFAWKDGGRDAGQMTVSYSTVADPTTFVTLATNAGGTGLTKLHINIIDDAGYLATGVSQIKFVSGAMDAGEAGVGEIDVAGVAVPEPATMALLGLGLGMLLRRRS